MTVVKLVDCREWFDGRADLEIKKLIDSNTGMDGAVVYNDGYTFVLALHARKKTRTGILNASRGRLCGEKKVCISCNNI